MGYNVSKIMSVNKNYSASGGRQGGCGKKVSRHTPHHKLKNMGKQEILKLFLSGISLQNFSLLREGLG